MENIDLEKFNTRTKFNIEAVTNTDQANLPDILIERSENQGINVIKITVVRPPLILCTRNQDFITLLRLEW